MALSENSTKEALAVKFTELGSWIGVYVNGGTTEAVGGSPAYARKQTTWDPGSTDGVVTGSQVEIDLPAGSYSHIGVFAAATGGLPIEKKMISTKTLDAQGKLLITATLTVT